jgi:hypothetical protein
MLGKQIEGYPPVKQFRKGNLYYMEYTAMPVNPYVIGIFKRILNIPLGSASYLSRPFHGNFRFRVPEDTIYYSFLRVITQDPAGSPMKTYSYNVSPSAMSLLKVRKLTTRELSLFINANYKAPSFDKLLKGNHEKKS